jgi:hypothetical protein
MNVDDILRNVVHKLVEENGCSWAAILFVEGDTLVTGPEAGEPDPGLRLQIPVVYNGTRVAELAADGCTDTALLELVAASIAEYCLVGWDNGGVEWSP